MTPLSAMLPTASNTTRRASPSSWVISGTRPKRMPWSESQRMQAPMRLVPSRAKQLTRAIAWMLSRAAGICSDQQHDERDSREGRGADDELRHARQAIARHRRLDHADDDRQTGHAEKSRSAIEPQVAAAQRHDEADEQRAEAPQLQRGGILDIGEIRTAVVEHHHLVD